MPLKGNVLKPLAKSVLTPLGLPAAEITDAATDKKMFGSGFTTPMISLFFSFFLFFFYISKKKTIKKSLVWTKKRCIKTSSSFNALDYKFKNFVIGAFGSCWLGAI